MQHEECYYFNFESRCVLCQNVDKSTIVAGVLLLFFAVASSLLVWIYKREKRKAVELGEWEENTHQYQTIADLYSNDDSGSDDDDDDDDDCGDDTGRGGSADTPSFNVRTSLLPPKGFLD
jgi:hypothetical protein